ncbi:MAG: hypothetical protein R2852_09400 [Bacteroidia bacterium]
MLNEREVLSINQNSNVAVCIESDKLVSVNQLMKSGECNGHPNNLGNPSLMSVIPNNQTTTSVGFSFPTTSNLAQNPSFPADFHVGIACPVGTLNKIKLNGVPIDTSTFTKTCNMSIGSVTLNPSIKYKLSSEVGFIAYMYAIGKDESYASDLGAGFENSITQLILEAK